MKTIDEVLDVLVGLNELDRNWIFGQLSPAQKSRLAAQLGTEVSLRESSAFSAESRTSPATSPDIEPVVEPARGPVIDAPAPVIAMVLKQEPAWVVHALLQAHEWTWEEDVRALLPAGTRLEVADMERTGVQFAPAVCDALVRALQDDLRAAHFPTGFIAPRSRLVRLVAGLRRAMRSRGPIAVVRP